MNLLLYPLLYGGPVRAWRPCRCEDLLPPTPLCSIHPYPHRGRRLEGWPWSAFCLAEFDKRVADHYWFWPCFLEIWRRSGQNCSLLSKKRIKSCEKSPLPKPTAALYWAPAVWRIPLPEKNWQIFYLKLLLDFLVIDFAYSVNNILAYLNITILPIL